MTHLSQTQTVAIAVFPTSTQSTTATIGSSQLRREYIVVTTSRLNVQEATSSTSYTSQTILRMTRHRDGTGYKGSEHSPARITPSGTNTSQKSNEQGRCHLGSTAPRLEPYGPHVYADPQSAASSSASPANSAGASANNSTRANQPLCRPANTGQLFTHHRHRTRRPHHAAVETLCLIIASLASG